MNIAIQQERNVQTDQQLLCSGSNGTADRRYEAPDGAAQLALEGVLTSGLDSADSRRELALNGAGESLVVTWNCLPEGGDFADVHDEAIVAIHADESAIDRTEAAQLRARSINCRRRCPTRRYRLRRRLPRARRDGDTRRSETTRVRVMDARAAGALHPCP